MIKYFNFLISFEIKKVVSTTQKSIILLSKFTEIDVVDQALSDPLLTAKFHYVFNVANQLHVVPFLSTYPNRFSYGLFLGTYLFEILKNVGRFYNWC